MNMPITTALDRLLDPVSRCLTPEAAQALVKVRVDSRTQARLDELADKCTAGQLSDQEKAEYQTYVVAIDLIAILQSRARKFLAKSRPGR